MNPRNDSRIWRDLSLAIAHFGRGQGDYEKEELPDSWKVRAGEFVNAEAGTPDRCQLLFDREGLALEFWVADKRVFSREMEQMRRGPAPGRAPRPAPGVPGPPLRSLRAPARPAAPSG